MKGKTKFIEEELIQLQLLVKKFENTNDTPSKKNLA